MAISPTAQVCVALLAMFDQRSSIILPGCPDKIRRTLGWKPAGTFRQLVDGMVEEKLAAIDSGATYST
jgi:GDP-D-mannose dehydratase